MITASEEGQKALRKVIEAYEQGQTEKYNQQLHPVCHTGCSRIKISVISHIRTLILIPSAFFC